MPDERFGSFYDFDVLTDAATEQLKVWLPEYLAGAERARGRAPGQVQLPRRWHVEDDINAVPPGELPAIALIAASTGDDPDYSVDQVDATYNLGVGAILAGPDHLERRRLGGIYGAAIRDLLLHQGIPGTATLRWLGTTPEEVTATDARGHTRMTVIVEFEVHVENVAQIDGGPFEHTPRPAPEHLEPLPDGPVVVDADVDLLPEPLED